MQLVMAFGGFPRTPIAGSELAPPAHVGDSSLRDLGPLALCGATLGGNALDAGQSPPPFALWLACIAVSNAAMATAVQKSTWSLLQPHQRCPKNWDTAIPANITNMRSRSSTNLIARPLPLF